MLFIRTKVVIISCVLSLLSLTVSAQNERGHVEVALRMIGHQILLDAGDSSSRVQPIEYSNGTYSVQFASAFDFTPNRLMGIVDSLAEAAKIASKYRVEVINKESDEVVYSSEISTDSSSIVPCNARYYDKASYKLQFTILEPFAEANIIASNLEHQNVATKESNGSLTLVWIVVGLILMIVGIVWWKRRSQPEEVLPTETVQIGRYRFDERNMKLFLNNNHVDLTSKETDLLKLLYSSVNNTLERDEILKVVWGDEGDYVGRTLDVFISKLRKKISEDENVRIVNVRGVGYKLILNE